ncbi:Dolichyl-phosphate-mannose-protein mannosyltransferase-domain-containing protein [Limtongia smithiae]|uniref:Dolichyl-phosphate-mannose-protein mannosyltransferase-domain-containing protein n=1 Tax=Limtongia smithiae TaxID=1125753 RepID=UPI0034CD53F2
MPPTSSKFSALPPRDKAAVLFLTGLAIVVRLYKIWEPDSVVFDEVHFGGFASKYIKGRYFMDVHPPLAKLLITLTGWVAGFDGNFDFKDIAKDYVDDVPYVAMRMLPGVMGVLVVPLAYMTLKAYDCASLSAFLGSIFVLFDNGLATQSRFILLDSPLIFFTALTAYAWANFNNQKQFTAGWYWFLGLTGLALGATVSVKWVGLFTIAWVGVTTIIGLWSLLGDLSVSPRQFLLHFFWRAVFLIGVPVLFYLGMFAVHFLCLVNPGDGDGFMSSEFQATLNNKGMDDTPASIAYGSQVTIRHLNTQGGYLHSHDHLYPTGSQQQQVTLYPHKDANNLWMFDNVTMEPEFDFREAEPVYLKNGDIVRLQHVSTTRRLHSHDVRPPVTEAEWQQEVSAYGYKGFSGDANDNFRIEIVRSESKPGEAQEYLRAIDTKFRLVHTMTHCALFSHKVKLPSWGYEQQEVTCARQGTMPNSLWYIEFNEHPMIPEDAEKVNYAKPGFLRKFAELQKVMWDTNAGLVASHTWDSRPESWPYLRRGINFWVRDHRQVYLLGNVFVWWLSSGSIVLFGLVLAVSVLRWQRGYKDFSLKGMQQFRNYVGTNVIAWALHYFPFFLLQRQLFLHHYLPALYFAILGVTVTLDVVFKHVLRGRRWLVFPVALALLAATVAIYVLLSPLIYGGKWTKGMCEDARLMEHWDFDCNAFYDDISLYDVPAPVAESVGSPVEIMEERMESAVEALAGEVHDEL